MRFKILLLSTLCFALSAIAGELYIPDHPRRDKPNFSTYEIKGIPVNYNDAAADRYEKLDILREIGGETKITSARQWLESRGIFAE